MSYKTLIIVLLLHITSMHAMQEAPKQNTAPTKNAEYKKIYDNIRHLIATKADLNAPQKFLNNEPPLLRLSCFDECADIIKELLQNGANSNIRHSRVISTITVHSFPLYTAVACRAPNAVKTLLLHSADCNMHHAESFDTALHKVMNQPTNGTNKYTKKKTKEIARLLFAHNVNVDALDAAQETPLMVIVKDPDWCDVPYKLRRYMVCLLLYHGANTTLKNKRGKTAAEIARTDRYLELATLIEKCHKPLVNNLTRLLSHVGSRGKGKAPFPADVARIIAEFRYCKTGV